jgi:hypothetical protein
MATKFIVMEHGYEYNDEYYHQPHCDGSVGTPTVIFSTRAKAEKEAKRLNDASGKTHRYLYEYDEEFYDLVEDQGKSIEEAIKIQGPKEIFYVVEVEEG